MAQYVRRSATVLIGNTEFLVDYEVSPDETVIESVRMRDAGNKSFGGVFDLGTIGLLSYGPIPLYDYLIQQCPLTASEAA